MTPSPVPMAILGLGRWGVHLFRNFLAQPLAQVVAVAEVSPELLEAARQRFSQTETGQCCTVQYCEDWQVVLAIPGLQAVVVATPAATHYPLIKAALEQGLHVLAEKPLGITVAECLELTDLAARRHCQLVVDHTYLFHPAVEVGGQVIQRGQLGSLRYGYATRTNLGPVRYDVDALWDLAIHDIAIFNHWLGDRPITVSAFGHAWLQPQAKPRFPLGICDMGWITLTYPQQFQVVVHVSWCNADKQRRLGVVGERGTLVLDELATSEKLTLYQGGVDRQGDRYLPQEVARIPLPIANTEPLAQVCAHFLNCVVTGQPSSLSSGQVATDLVKILTAISQALQQPGTSIDISY